ncbi:MAG TPA: M50 family metallopeptidase [Candidatus Acidoferrales bacterium]|nr:M50 family metallopeptidase [Candidatus Acidoferrales bacterium]
MPALQDLVGAISVALMFMLLVAPHEGGHFALAKLFGVRVHEYSLGLGTKLWSTTRGGTLYALRLLPLGGYVRLAGMEPGDYDAPGGFHSRSAWQRAGILVAGPAVNFVLAAVIMVCIYMTQLNSDPGKVVAVIKSGPAYAQGLRPGDSIVSLNGVGLKSEQQIRNVESAAPTATLQLTVRHPDGSTFPVAVKPAYDASSHRYLIGIEGAPVVGPVDALRAGAQFPIVATGVIVGGMVELARGQIPGGFFGPNGATGPIGIGYVTFHAALAGLTSWFSIAAILSMALGLANLLPLPALDGGRLVVVALEALRRRPFNREREMQFQRAGLVGMLALMALIAFFDVQRLAGGQFPGMK